MKNIAFLGLLVIVAGCSSGKSKEEPTVVKIKGDPIAFVKGSALSSDKGFKAELFEADGKVEFSVSGFIEQHKDEDDANTIADQDPNKKAEAEPGYQLAAVAGTSYQFNSKEASAGTPRTQYLYTKTQNEYRLKEVAFQGQKMIESTDPEKGFVVLHTSTEHTGTAGSTLIYFGPKGQRVMLNLVVMNSTKQKTVIETITGEFEYLFGKGQKVRWENKKNIQISICGDISLEYKNRLPKAAQDWANSSNGLIGFQTTTQSQCPPFSDLNTRTFFFVDNYVEFPDLDKALQGATMVIPNMHEGRFLDGDVFFLKKEIEDALILEVGSRIAFDDERLRSNPYMLDFISRLATHELGHFLGLHHQFNPSYPSIMSYDDKVSSIQAYDKEALQKLYAD